MAGLPRGLSRPGLILALIAFGVASARPALAESGNADGTVTAYPLPATAQEAYSPIGEGFESPLEAREDLKGPKPYIDERRSGSGPNVSSSRRLRSFAIPSSQPTAGPIGSARTPLATLSLRH